MKLALNFIMLKISDLRVFTKTFISWSRKDEITRPLILLKLDTNIYNISKIHNLIKSRYFQVLSRNQHWVLMHQQFQIYATSPKKLYLNVRVPKLWSAWSYRFTKHECIIIKILDFNTFFIVLDEFFEVHLICSPIEDFRFALPYQIIYFLMWDHHHQRAFLLPQIRFWGLYSHQVILSQSKLVIYNF